ncbi:hypothetical protein ANN_19147, partial [Periplaneta americana]
LLLENDRLQETLSKLGTLDDTIHDLLLDSEYDDDVEKCEEYLDSAKCMIQKASRRIGDRLSTSMTNTSISDKQTVTTAPTQASITHSFRLPPINLEPFSGDVETWALFWEQFESSIDKDPSLSTINKHILLLAIWRMNRNNLLTNSCDCRNVRGDEENTTDALRRQEQDNSAHLDYLEDVKPIRIATPEALNTTYIECHQQVQALQALGEDVNGYGRILAPKILQAFPDDICRR